MANSNFILFTTNIIYVREKIIEELSGPAWQFRNQPISYSVRSKPASLSVFLNQKLKS
jgi:hypothetical protein